MRIPEAAYPSARFVWAMVGALSVSGGCADSPVGGTPVLRTDSAGVEIVETITPVWAEGEEWTVDSVSLLTIGEVAGDSLYLFGQILGAIRIENRIFIGDQQTQEVRVYGLSGQFESIFAGSGEGPGEIGFLMGLGRCMEDRLLVWDLADRTVQIREADGTVIREMRVVESESEYQIPPSILKCSPYGEGFVAAGQGDAGEEFPNETSILRMSAPVWRMNDEGSPVADLGSRLRTELFHMVSASGSRSGRDHPFRRGVSLTFGFGRTYVGTGETFEVDVFDAPETLRRKLRAPAEDLAVTDSFIEQLRASEDIPGRWTGRAMFEEYGYLLPESLPAFTEMHLDPVGNLWVRRFLLPWEIAERWGVFDPDGAFLGHVELPDRFELTDLGEDWVLGISTDELGVQRVIMWELIRS